MSSRARNYALCTRVPLLVRPANSLSLGLCVDANSCAVCVNNSISRSYRAPINALRLCQSIHGDNMSFVNASTANSQSAQ